MEIFNTIAPYTCSKWRVVVVGEKNAYIVKQFLTIITASHQSWPPWLTASSGKPILPNTGVSIVPGLSTLTFIFLSNKSAEKDRANDRTPTFAVLYTVIPGKALWAVMEATNMIEEPYQEKRSIMAYWMTTSPQNVIQTTILYSTNKK